MLIEGRKPSRIVSEAAYTFVIEIVKQCMLLPFFKQMEVLYI